MSNLYVKTIVGFVALLVILGLALFISAGSFDFWQAWVYLAVFAICTILVTAYLMKYDQRLLEGRVNAGPAAETQKTQQVIQSVASLFFIALFVVPGLDFRFHWSNVPPIVSWVADGFVVLGFFLVFLVFRENSYTSGTIQVSDEQKVISTGPYSLVRHPMYAGAAPLVIFTPLALGSWVALPFVIPLLLVIVLRLLEEEKFLVANLPGYAVYRERVRYRLVPFVW